MPGHKRADSTEYRTQKFAAAGAAGPRCVLCSNDREFSPDAMFRCFYVSDELKRIVSKYSYQYLKPYPIG